MACETSSCIGKEGGREGGGKERESMISKEKIRMEGVVMRTTSVGGASPAARRSRLRDGAGGS